MFAFKNKKQIQFVQSQLGFCFSYFLKKKQTSSYSVAFFCFFFVKLFQAIPSTPKNVRQFTFLNFDHLPRPKTQPDQTFRTPPTDLPHVGPTKTPAMWKVKHMSSKIPDEISIKMQALHFFDIDSHHGEIPLVLILSLVSICRHIVREWLGSPNQFLRIVFSFPYHSRSLESQGRDVFLQTNPHQIIPHWKGSMAIATSMYCFIMAPYEKSHLLGVVPSTFTMVYLE